MTITGLPRPLPECSTCGDPMPRAAWRTRRRCAECSSTAELLAAAHTRHDLERVAALTTRRANARIEALAARRAARTVPA